nr:immunoglobulin light chain junction region [Macaca mulatta]MOW52158.1 immunoglobulin light chain junction region [Macaca mulatta]MOW54297.1 immunoglobulin light chain junction region [Macaca mulatta]MOW54729.1 immunoglobulin light chain junction region [Macaca mulatta]MOW55769.1 immunoglobulin light chain junction region [Macaca mulatta]
CLQAYTMPYSF